MRVQDWKHRLTVLRAWQSWCDIKTMPNFPASRATYCAVLDGCAITVRALCQELGVGANFKGWATKLRAHAGKRILAMMECCQDTGGKVAGLDDERRRCFLEVLYLANRAVAHPQDGDLDHAVDRHEMTSAINTLLQWLDKERPAGLPCDCPDLLQPIPEPQDFTT